MLDRRRFVLVALLPVQWAHAQSANALAERLRAGRCALLMRHAQTDPGVGDPPGFRLGACSTQRNLNEDGRAQARVAGEWFRSRKLQPAAVLSSAWCRCVDTATLAFGSHELWPPLNSGFGRSGEPSQLRATLLSRLAGIGPGSFEVWVTHGANIFAFTGESTSMGEGVLVDSAGKALGHGTFT